MEERVILNKHKEVGFSFIEVMIAISIIAITLTTLLGSQSRSLTYANNAKFSTTVSLLAQSKMAEYETMSPKDLISDSGDFGEEFPGYRWNLIVNEVAIPGAEEVSERLKQIDMSISWGEDEDYLYSLRLYRFVPKGN